MGNMPIDVPLLLWIFADRMPGQFGTVPKFLLLLSAPRFRRLYGRGGSTQQKKFWFQAVLSLMHADLVRGFANTLPWAEAVIGLLILLGAATRPALISGALMMAVLTFGASLLQDWNVAGVQMIYAVVYFLLLAFAEHNQWSIDGLVEHYRQ